MLRPGTFLRPGKVVPLKDEPDTYKLLKRGRSPVLLVSMATMLGTSELMTEDLNRKQESKNSEIKEKQKTKNVHLKSFLRGVSSGIWLWRSSLATHPT